MIRKELRIVSIVILLAGGFLLAKDFWEKPYTEWKKADVNKMLGDSPWAKTQTTAEQVGGKGSGVGGDKEIYNNVVIRFFSALPVRQAYVRTMQLMNNYDSKSESEKAEIDAKFGRILKIDFSKMIIVALEYSTNDQERRMNVKRYLENTKVEQLKQSCYLISDRLGRIELQEYYPPSPDGTGAKFVFPRMVGDKPAVTAEDKEVKFDLYLSPVNQRVFLTFKINSMMHGGELAI
ncbi:MAG TPA: hypothetical protein VGQ81_01765 [Acidobacteriota bacterium]|nr:hypothetical protein [Acidobacteriota bacterium]